MARPEAAHRLGHRSAAPWREAGRERSMAEQVEIGATVVATDGEVGSVERVVADPATGELGRLVVRTRAGDQVDVPAALIDPDSTAREVRLRATGAGLTGAAVPVGISALTDVGDRLVVPVRE